MSQRVRRLPTPFGYEGALSDLAWHRHVGYRVIVHGVALTAEGVDLPPLHKWFRRDDLPHRLGPLVRFACRRCRQPVAVLWLVRDEPGRAQPVAALTYQRRRLTDGYSEVETLDAVMHLPDPAGGCKHGPLVAHPADSPAISWCRAHGEVSVEWTHVAEAIRDIGGWQIGESDLPKRTRLVMLG